MNKAETKLIKAEIRDLKRDLSKRQKIDARTIAGHRAHIRRIERERAGFERDIATIQSGLSLFEKTTNDRIAILDGRLGL